MKAHTKKEGMLECGARYYQQRDTVVANIIPMAKNCCECKLFLKHKLQNLISHEHFRLYNRCCYSQSVRYTQAGIFSSCGTQRSSVCACVCVCVCVWTCVHHLHQAYVIRIHNINGKYEATNLSGKAGTWFTYTVVSQRAAMGGAPYKSAKEGGRPYWVPKKWPCHVYSDLMPSKQIIGQTVMYNGATCSSFKVESWWHTTIWTPSCHCEHAVACRAHCIGYICLHKDALRQLSMCSWVCHWVVSFFGQQHVLSCTLYTSRQGSPS